MCSIIFHPGTDSHQNFAYCVSLVETPDLCGSLVLPIEAFTRPVARPPTKPAARLPTPASSSSTQTWMGTTATGRPTVGETYDGHNQSVATLEVEEVINVEELCECMQHLWLQ